MTADYKQLAEELYYALKDLQSYINYFDTPVVLIEKYDNLIQKYEEATTRGTGRTTALYMKAIAEALANPGKSIEFVDHYPHKNHAIARSHVNNLQKIIARLGYNIAVSKPLGGFQVFLYNNSGQ